MLLTHLLMWNMCVVAKCFTQGNRTLHVDLLCVSSDAASVFGVPCTIWWNLPTSPHFRASRSSDYNTSCIRLVITVNTTSQTWGIWLYPIPSDVKLMLTICIVVFVEVSWFFFLSTYFFASIPCWSIMKKTLFLSLYVYRFETLYIV